MSTPDSPSHEPRQAGDVAMRFLETLTARAEATGDPEYRPPEWVTQALAHYEAGDREAARAILQEHAEELPDDDTPDNAPAHEQDQLF